jgi:hypothetical protein
MTAFDAGLERWIFEIGYSTRAQRRTISDT